MQYVLINGISFDQLKVNFGVPQGSSPSTLVFFMYINYLHISVRLSYPFHFSDDAGLLSIQDIICVINKLTELH